MRGLRADQRVPPFAYDERDKMEFKISIDTKEFDQLMKDYPEASNRALYARITEACEMLENRLKGHTPEGAGPANYRDSIFSKVEFGQKLEYGVPIRGIVSSPFSYGEPLEYGRGPGKGPPIKPENPILFWVEKKLKYRGKEAKSVAFLISRSIKRHGTKGAHMYEKTVKENEALVKSILNKILDDIVRMLKK